MHPQVFLTPSAQKYPRWHDLNLIVVDRLARAEMIENFYEGNPGASRKSFLSPTVYPKAEKLGIKR